MTHFISQWILPPTIVSEMAALYGYAEVLLKDATATHEVYQRAVISYVRHLEQLNVFQPGWSERFACCSAHLDTAEIKAVLHRVNCQVLQILAHKEVCDLPCCCRCPGAYEAMPCIRPIFAQMITETDPNTAN